MQDKTKQIRALNDELRKTLLGGGVVMTLGIAALGEEAVKRIVQTIAAYDDFCHAIDPYEEHDVGTFKAGEHTIMFKIDYYDRSFRYLSPDPADPAVTERVMTIMLANEW